MKTHFWKIAAALAIITLAGCGGGPDLPANAGMPDLNGIVNAAGQDQANLNTAARLQGGGSSPGGIINYQSPSASTQPATQPQPSPTLQPTPIPVAGRNPYTNPPAPTPVATATPTVVTDPCQSSALSPGQEANCLGQVDAKNATIPTAPTPTTTTASNGQTVTDLTSVVGYRPQTVR